MSTVVRVVFQDSTLQKELCEELQRRKFIVSEDTTNVTAEDILLTDDEDIFTFVMQILPDLKSDFISKESADVEGVMRAFTALMQQI